MRISDWSSDVCSSDLAPCKAQWRADIGGFARRWSRSGAADNGFAAERLSRWNFYRQRLNRSHDNISRHSDHPCRDCDRGCLGAWYRLFPQRSEEHTSELQSLMRISYAVFCLKEKIDKNARCTMVYCTSTAMNHRYHRVYS